MNKFSLSMIATVLRSHLLFVYILISIILIPFNNAEQTYTKQM